MSHHLSGPDLKSPSDDARLDLTDVFAFTTSNGSRAVLIMNVNPDFGGQANAFHPDAVYRINIDADGDSVQISPSALSSRNPPAEYRRSRSTARPANKHAHTMPLERSSLPTLR
jgi:hypothetical protein